MSQLIFSLNLFLPLLYAFAGVNYLLYFIRQDDTSKRLCTPALGAAFAFNIVLLIVRGVHFSRFPMLGLGEVLSVVTSAVAFTYLYVEHLQRKTPRHKNTGAFIVPMTMLLHGSASLLYRGDSTKNSELLTHPLFGIHSLGAVLSYSAFTVSAVYAVMFLLLYRALKTQQFGIIFERLPSLEQLSKMAFGATVIGWLALTLTIGLGDIMSSELVPDFAHDPKFISAAITWVCYALALSSHFIVRWPFARTVYILLFSFIVAVGSIWVSTFVLDSFHSF